MSTLVILKKQEYIQTTHTIQRGKNKKMVCVEYLPSKAYYKLIQLGKPNIVLPHRFDTIKQTQDYARKNYGCCPRKIVGE